MTLLGRPGDSVAAAITNAVVMAAAELAPHDTWQQPVLRLADTVIGVAIGIAAAWIACGSSACSLGQSPEDGC